MSCMLIIMSPMRYSHQLEAARHSCFSVSKLLSPDFMSRLSVCRSPFVVLTSTEDLYVYTALGKAPPTSVQD
jgi:hypothetical protein